MAGFGLTSDYTSLNPLLEKKKSGESDTETKREFRSFEGEMDTEWVRKWEEMKKAQSRTAE